MCARSSGDAPNCFHVKLKAPVSLKPECSGRAIQFGTRILAHFRRTALASTKSARATKHGKAPRCHADKPASARLSCRPAIFCSRRRTIKMATAGAIGRMERPLTVQLKNAANTKVPSTHNKQQPATGVAPSHKIRQRQRQHAQAAGRPKNDLKFHERRRCAGIVCIFPTSSAAQKQRRRSKPRRPPNAARARCRQSSGAKNDRRRQAAAGERQRGERGGGCENAKHNFSNAKNEVNPPRATTGCVRKAQRGELIDTQRRQRNQQ